MLSFIKSKLKKIYSQFTSSISGFFSRTALDPETLKELEILLLSADTGVPTTRYIISELKATASSATPSSLRERLAPILTTILEKPTHPFDQKKVFMLVGVNGSGKTTFAAKFAHWHARHGKRVLLVAADTFRAAAPAQLNTWADRSGVDIELGKTGEDPAAVVFRGCDRFKKEQYDILIIDTAGRLQTKVHLMEELSKMKRVIGKHIPEESVTTLLTIDSMLGQNSLEQARLFKESTDVTGIVLTKMDGTGKGGIVFGISRELAIPITFITFGEHISDLKEFDAPTFVAELLDL